MDVWKRLETSIREEKYEEARQLALDAKLFQKDRKRLQAIVLCGACWCRRDADFGLDHDAWGIPGVFSHDPSELQRCHVCRRSRPIWAVLGAEAASYCQETGADPAAFLQTHFRDPRHSPMVTPMIGIGQAAINMAIARAKFILKDRYNKSPVP